MANNLSSKLKIISVEDFKQSTKRLTEIFKNRNIPIKHSEALEIMSNINGYKDYNTFVAIAKKTNEDTHRLLLNILNSQNEIENKVQAIHSNYVNEEIINMLISDLENILYFYEDQEGNYLSIRRASFDVIDFEKNSRIEDFIIVELKNNYIDLEKVKINIFDKNHEILDYQDVLKLILNKFKNIRIKESLKPEDVRFLVKGILSKNFEYKELEVSYYHNNFSINLAKTVDNKNHWLTTSLKIFINNELFYDDRSDDSIKKVNELVDKYNLSEWKTFNIYTNAVNKYKNHEGFIIKADNEKLYYPGIGTMEDRINDSLHEISRIFIIKAIEYIMNKEGIYQSLKNELENAQSNSNADYFFTCSSTIIKEIIKNYNPSTKKFEIALNSTICNLERTQLH